MVREAAVRPIETAAKIRNCSARLSTPTTPANAAASAPMPNQSITKPELKTSATMRINPSTTHAIHSQLILLTEREVPEGETRRNGEATDRERRGATERERRGHGDTGT